MDNSQKSHKSKSNAWRTKELSEQELSGLRTYKKRETCSRRTPVQDGQFSLHQGCLFYRDLTVQLKDVIGQQLVMEIKQMDYPLSSFSFFLFSCLVFSIVKTHWLTLILLCQFFW